MAEREERAGAGFLQGWVAERWNGRLEMVAERWNGRLEMVAERWNGWLEMLTERRIEPVWEHMVMQTYLSSHVTYTC